MASDYLLGIDIGTYESKGVLTDTGGHIVADAVAPHDLSVPRPGWAEHDADDVWWHDLRYLSQELFSRSGVTPEEVACVGCSAIGPCVLPVDTEGHPLRPAILYGIDTRAMDEVRELSNTLGTDWIVEKTGSALSSQAAGPKILWIQRHEPEIWARTRRLMTSTSYLVYRLTGQVLMDHYTASAYGPLYNLHMRGWDPRALKCVCSDELLPGLGWTTAIAGEVTSSAAKETGLAVGTPVIVGTADAAAEAIGGGVVAPGDTMLMYGTTLFLIEICEDLPRGGTVWPALFLEPDTYALTSGMATAGALTRWFRDEFARLELEVEKEGGDSSYAVLAAEAAEVSAGADGLLTLPYFSGERAPINDPFARGVVAGLTLSHSRAHVYRSLLESVAYGVRHNLEALAEAGEPPQRLVAIGGGTKNLPWLQIVSDVTGQEQEIRRTPGASYGDALLAGVGIGAFASVATAVQEWLDEAELVKPNPDTRALYDRYFSLYCELYESTLDVVHVLARLVSDKEC